MEQNQQTDDRCHQCKANGASEIELVEAHYVFKGKLCKVHAAEMKSHFDTLKQKPHG